MNEIAMDGPAGGRPCKSAPALDPVRMKFTSRSSTWACRIDGASKCSPAAAVPVRTKIPDPMIAPMPSAIIDQGPRAFRRRCSGSAASAISLSMDLQQRSWLGFAGSVALSAVGDGPKSPRLFGVGGPSPASYRKGAPPSRFSKRGIPCARCLPLRLSARHLLDFALLRSASVLARLQRMLGLALFSCGALCFLTVFFAQCGCIGHECVMYSLLVYVVLA